LKQVLARIRLTEQAACVDEWKHEYAAWVVREKDHQRAKGILKRAAIRMGMSDMQA